MRIGIFAKTFRRPTLQLVLDAVAAHGIRELQFNMSCAGLPSLPDATSTELHELIRGEMASRALTMSAVSGTFNMIHPSRSVREQGLERLGVLASAAETLGTSLITLCPGSRDPRDMWGPHPENRGSAAWRDLLESVERALTVTEATKVSLCIEPEASTVLDSAASARRLLDEMKSPRLRIVMDPANLPGIGPSRMREVLEEAFDLLGEDTALAHAKELARDGRAGNCALGEGLLDFRRYLELLRHAGFDGPLIVHGVREEEVEQSIAFLGSLDTQAGPSPAKSG